MIQTLHTSPQYPERNWQGLPFQTLFEQQVAETPRAIALSCEDGNLTYAELNAYANQVGFFLRSLGIGPEQMVGLLWERARRPQDLFILLLGILKAGGAYLYLDSALPAERLAFMLRDAGVALVLTEERVATSILPTEAPVICLDREWPPIVAQSMTNPPGGATIETLAYLIYTSGSTGGPKGVRVTHRGLGNLAAAEIHALQLQPGDRVSQFFSPGFDASVSEICKALLSGATLCPVPSRALRPGPALLAFLREQAITVATFTPTILAALPPADLPDLRVIIAGGEVCPATLVSRWSAPDRLFINAYGPTEATVCVTFGPCLTNGLPPTIGRPIPHVVVTIRDPVHLPVATGEAGEICISGPCLARGYTDPQLTAERFVADPLEPASTIYLTGDRGHFEADGSLVFQGRVDGDDEVKLRGGFRVRLGEIEAALAPYVAACAALVIEEVLVACVVLPSAQQISIDELRTHLEQQLPAYMIPRAFVVCEALPRTVSDKIDRQALRLSLPDWRRFAHDGVFVAPRTALEQRLAALVAETLNRNYGELVRALSGTPDTRLEENTLARESLLDASGINMHSRFDQMGGDSLSLADLLLSIADEFHVELDESEVNEYSLAQLATMIQARGATSQGKE
jgi:amino acid adenylation domain-containing protein